jgi:hypothetical protein
MRSSEISRSCGEPGCTHEHDGDLEEMYIHAGCHMGSQLTVRVVGDCAIVACGSCGRLVCDLDLVP